MAGDKADHALERLVFFSDAVFAIAITLLVIEIHPPHLEHDATTVQHLQALANLTPEIIGYVVSFWVIGAFWMGHHRAFCLAAHYSPRILGWNMALLNVIAFMPFVSAYLSVNQGEAVPTVTYCAAMTLAALLNFKVNRTATSAPMLDERADPEAVRYVRLRGLSVLLGAASSLVLAYFLPSFAQLALITIPFWRLALTRLHRPVPAAG